MKRIPQTKLVWLWPVALLLLVVLHFWSPKLGAGIRNDSYSTTAEGKKALVYLLEDDPEQQGHSVRRNRDPLPRFLHSKPGRFGSRQAEKPVLCLLGPSRYPNSVEWKRILEWVHSGGLLVIAARHANPEFKIEPLKIAVKRIRGQIDADSTSIHTQLIDNGRLLWRSRARIVASARARRLVEADGSTQAVIQEHGSGHVVVVASDFIFSNQSLAWADHSNAELALRLLEYNTLVREVVIDESLNISGTPKVVGLFLNPLFKPLTIQLLMGLLIFGWWRSRRFGPLQPDVVVARHNIVDHTDAVGAMHFKSRDGATALRAYLRQFFTELNLKAHKGREDRVFEPIAVRLGKTTQEIRELFRKSAKAARNPHLDRRTAAAIIRKLAVLRKAIRQRPMSRNRKTNQNLLQRPS
ncbi:MAG: hypothetical protein Tsb009_28210 [Planctomycetaceae bacterium]